MATAEGNMLMISDKEKQYLIEAQNSLQIKTQIKENPPHQSLQNVNPHEIAMELLSREWLDIAGDDLNTKLYLAEKVLPILVLSLEQLLVSVTRKGLEDQENFRDDFNPVNFVAEFLMRHNPRYPLPQCASSSLYYNGMKEVAAELRQKITGYDDDVIARVKGQLKEKREKEKALREAKIEEERRKKIVIAELVQIWKIDNSIPIKQIQQVTEAWLGDHDDIKDKFNDFLNQPDDTNDEQLLQTLQPLSIMLSDQEFEQFTKHLIECGKERHRAILKVQQRSIFKEVFTYCDTANLNVINRQHLMSLFCIFYENTKMKESLTDPKKWPSSGGEQDNPTQEEWEREGSTVSDEDYQEFMTSPSHGTTDLPQEEQPVLPPPSESQTNFSFTTTETQSTHFESFKERLATKQISPTVTTVLPKGPGEQWSPKHVDMSQFLQLCDLFLGEEPNSEMAESLASFLKRNYMAENSEELGTNAISSALLKMKKVHKIAEIFTLWDTDCSGYIHADEVIAVLSHWENFGTDEGKFQIETALEMLGMVGRQVSRIQFTALAEILTDDMTSAHFKEFVDVITTSIKLSKEQQQRNEFRQDLLYKIKKAGYNSTGEILPSLQAAVKAIQKDCINFGGNKKVSVIIGLLERNNEGTEYLHYKAASDDCLYNVIGKKVNHKQLPVSFGAIKGNIPIHIPNMYEHGKVHFFIPTHSNTKEFQGSLVVAPIVTPTGQSIGAISVDFIIPANKGSHNFMDHEIAFYQGVGVCLGEVYKAAIARKKLLGAAEAGILWLLRRCQAINQIDFYLIRSEDNNEENEAAVDHKDSNYLLQLALHSSNNMNQKIIHCNHLIRKKDNYFKEYLFNCVETSETVTAEVYCHQHLCCPLRDTNGCTIATLDLTLNMKTSTLDPQQARDINKMIKLLTTAFHQSSNSEDTSDKSVTLLFHQLLLSDLQTCMFKLDKKAFAELRSYNEPPDTILKIIQVLVMILHPDANSDTWNKCKPYINIDLLKLMEVYQPQADLVHPKLNEILSTLSSIVPNEVFRHGSLPAKYLYTWISACGAVLEHSNAGNIEITSEEKN